MLSISVLGPVEIQRFGEPVSVPRGKTSELLVRLALEAGVFVSTDRLLEDLWSDDAVHTTRNTLHSKVAKLRRALGDPAVLLNGDGGYVLAVDPAEIDAHAVLRHAAEASGMAARGDHAAAADVCASSLSMFRGELLAGAGTGDWVTAHRARLEAARLQLLETWFSARMRLGQPAGVIGELEEALHTYPFQESLWVLLITALYQCGRQADALAVHRRIRRLLADELGLEPGPRLQQLEQQILTHDPALDPASSASASDGVAVGNLPSMFTELVGREELVAELVELVATRRLVNIVGPGGVGKTAVAIATARRLRAPGGVWLARLDVATTADDVIDTVIAALDVTGGEAALLDRLRRTDSIVILDNCEHVVDAAAQLAVELLDASPGLRLLCTSQIPLGINGEAVIELAPLPLDDAVELFTRRAIAQRSGRGLTDAAEAVNKLCRSLDGLPLAIELAAARTKTLSVEDITRRLDDRFHVLRDPTSLVPGRRQALGETIRWSYELLFPDDQRGLWALATFPGDATLDAVEFVLDALDVPSAAAIDVVGRLANRSLVIVDDDGPTNRYRLLDSIRAFALQAMSDAGTTDDAMAANARWFAAAAASSTSGVRSSHQAEHLTFARVERANIDGALAWSVSHQPLLALDIVNGFGWAWVVLGDSRGAQRVMTALDAAGDAASAGNRSAALLLAAWLEASTGELERARHHITVASALADAVDDDDLRARCLYYLAYVVSHDGDFEQALELTNRSAALYAPLDRSWDQAANALFGARAAISAGDEARAVDASRSVQRWLAEVDDPWLHVRGDAMLGELARLQHRFDDAVAHISRAANTSRQRGYLQTEAYQVASLGRAQCQAGDYASGAASLQSAIDKAEATGDVRMAALARVHLGRVLRALGQHSRARAVLEAAAAWHREAGGGEQARLGECLLAAIDAHDGVPDATQRLADLLDAARAHREPHVEVFALDALARSATREGDLEHARCLRVEADARMDAAAHFITERDRTDKHDLVDPSTAATSG